LVIEIVVILRRSRLVNATINSAEKTLHISGGRITLPIEHNQRNSTRDKNRHYQGREATPRRKQLQWQPDSKK